VFLRVHPNVSKFLRGKALAGMVALVHRNRQADALAASASLRLSGRKRLVGSKNPGKFYAVRRIIGNFA